MSSVLGATQLFVLTFAVFTVATAALIALAQPWLRPRLVRLAPARRARILSLLALAPLAVGLFHALLCFVPGVVGVLFPELDHCLVHEHGTAPHLCFAHLPGDSGTLAGWTLAALAAAALLVPTLARLRRVRRTARLLRQLVATATPDARTGALLVESEVPLAAATIVSPEVLVSSSLAAALPAELLDAVVAHERAHLRRQDPRWRLLLSLLSVGHLPRTRRALLADYELASEQACDDEAGASVGDRLNVARALVAVERLMAGRPAPLGCAATGFGGSHLVARVEALLAPPLTAAGRVSGRAIVAALVLTSVALSDPLHHAAEALVGLLIA